MGYGSVCVYFRLEIGLCVFVAVVRSHPWVLEICRYMKQRKHDSLKVLSSVVSITICLAGTLATQSYSIHSLIHVVCPLQKIAVFIAVCYCLAKVPTSESVMIRVVISWAHCLLGHNFPCFPAAISCSVVHSGPVVLNIRSTDGFFGGLWITKWIASIKKKKKNLNVRVLSVF